MGDGEEFTFIGIEGGQDHAVHFEGEFCVVAGGFAVEEFGRAEVLVEVRGDVVVVVVRTAGEAAANAYGQEQGGHDCECAFHIFKFLCYRLLFRCQSICEPDAKKVVRLKIR